MSENASRIKNSSRNILFGAVDRITAIVFPFIVRTIFIKFLGEDYLGLSSLYSSILQVINLVDLGFASAISAALYRPIAENNLEKANALLRLYDRLYKKIALVITTIGLLVTPFLQQFINGTPPYGVNIYCLWIIYLLHTVIGYYIFAYRVTLLSAMQRSDIASLVAAIIRTVIGIVQILLIVELKNIYVYAIMNVVYTGLYNFFCGYICKKKFPQYKKEGIVDTKTNNVIKRNVVSLAFQKIGNTISISLDSIIISAFLGLSTVAIYCNYNYVISAIVIFISLLVTSITASIGNSIATEGENKNYKDFMKIFLMHSWIISWCCVCFLILFNDFMYIWMGDGLLLSTSVIITLIGRFYFEQIRRVVLNYKDAAGLWIRDRWRPIIGCFVNLLLNIITVKHFGVIGVAISTIIAFAMVELPWETRVLFRDYFRRSEREYIKCLIKNMIFTGINAFIIFYMCTLIPLNGWSALLIKIPICIVLPNFMLLLEYKSDPNFDSAKALAYRVVDSIARRTC